MDIRIDTSSDVPIRRQLTEQVIFLIATERLQHGDLLPSVRELARRLKVHHNTVSEAYQDLVRRKWLERRRGSRLFLLDLVERFDEKRKTTCGNQSRNGGNFVNTSVNQHESPADIFAGCQPNTFQMPPKYHAESDVKVRKNPRYGDNIENRIDGQSLLAHQGRLLALFRTAPMLNSPKIRHTFLTRDGSTTIAVESLLLNPRNYSRLDPLSEKHPKPGFSFVGTMKSIGIDYLSARQIVCPTSRRFYYRRGHHVR